MNRWTQDFRREPNALFKVRPGVRAKGKQERYFYTPSMSFLEFADRLLDRRWLTGDDAIITAIALRMNFDASGKLCACIDEELLAATLSLSGRHARRTVGDRVDSLLERKSPSLRSLGMDRFTFHGEAWNTIAPAVIDGPIWSSDLRKADESWSQRKPTALKRREAVPEPDEAVQDSDAVQEPEKLQEPGGDSGTIYINNYDTGFSESQSSELNQPGPLPCPALQAANPEGARGPVRSQSAAASSSAVTARAREDAAAAADAASRERSGRVDRFEFVVLVTRAIDETGRISWPSAIELFRNAVAGVPGTMARRANADDEAVRKILETAIKPWREAGLPARELFETLYDKAQRQISLGQAVNGLGWASAVLSDKPREAVALNRVLADTSPSVSEQTVQTNEVVEEAEHGQTFDLDALSPAELAIAAILSERVPILDEADEDMAQAWDLAKIEDVVRTFLPHDFDNGSRSTISTVQPVNPAEAAQRFQAEAKQLLVQHPDFEGALVRKLGSAVPEGAVVTQAVGGILYAIVRAGAPLDQVLDHIGRRSAEMMLRDQRFEGWGAERYGRPINGVRRCINEFLASLETRRPGASAAISQAATVPASTSEPGQHKPQQEISRDSAQP